MPNPLYKIDLEALCKFASNCNLECYTEFIPPKKTVVKLLEFSYFQFNCTFWCRAN